MVNTEIEGLLRKILGLKVTTIGQSTLKRAITRRMEALSCTDEEAYTQKIKSSVMELNELIEEVVIPETWFFRDREPFTVLTEFLKTKGSIKNRRTVRLLSAPCSTGEEPYSLAIAMLQNGWPTDKFQVVGIDISTRALTKAQAGKYNENSFRDNSEDFRKNYFRKKEQGYFIHDYIRKLVELKHGNLLNPSFVASLGKFDVIFCKNVLIYLDDESKKRTIRSLERQLNEEGLLFVGHAETGLFTDSNFSQLPYPKAFAFKKISLAKKATSSQRTEPAASEQRPKPERKRLKTPPPSPEQTADNLRKARSLADQGRLQAAIQLCENTLRQSGPSAQAYFLLGILLDATGKTVQGEKTLRKALYLEPDHMEALLHLALLADRSGDLVKAGSIRERIKRLQNQNDFTLP